MRKPIQIMLSLIGLVKPLFGYMLLAITLGSLGHLCAILIPSLGFYGLLHIFLSPNTFDVTWFIVLIIGVSVLRGIFRYGEQMSNHYIAFKILAQIRHTLMVKLQALAPAKLDQKHKGNLISTLTTDVELLEVFYAHTLSPIAIGWIVGVILVIFFSFIHWGIALLAGFSYILMGWGVPRLKTIIALKVGFQLREKLASIQAYYLDHLRGIHDIIQYHGQADAQNQLKKRTEEVESSHRTLRQQEAFNRVMSDGLIVIALLIMLLLTGYLVINQNINSEPAVLAFGVFVSSFGPFMALSMLSNNLHMTLASGQRILDLLEEEPPVKDILVGHPFTMGDIVFHDVGFKYDQEEVLINHSMTLKKHIVTGLYGQSGQGKSTIAKLLQRFYLPDSGNITINGVDINTIKSQELRKNIAYLASRTEMFNTTILENIRLGRLNATKEEVIEASKKASMHEFIMSLPLDYNTLVHELGDRLSEGEKQRIGLARLFISHANVWILDEPTSNIDSLNEAIILKSLHNMKKDKTILIISHRQSTLSNTDELIKLSKNELKNH